MRAVDEDERKIQPEVPVVTEDEVPGLPGDERLELRILEVAEGAEVPEAHEVPEVPE